MKAILEYSEKQGGIFHYGAEDEFPNSDWQKVIHNSEIIQSQTDEEFKILEKYLDLYDKHTPNTLAPKIDDISKSWDYYINYNEVYRFSKLLPCKPGVYFLYDHSFNLIYIGMAGSIKTRLPMSIKERKSFGPIYYSYAITNSPGDAAIYEIYYMAEQSKRPICNSIFYEHVSIKIQELNFTALDYCANINKKTPANIHRYNKANNFHGLIKKPKEKRNLFVLHK